MTPGGELVLNTGLSVDNPALLALALMGVATVISFLHLGTPQNAPYSLANLSGSWLSREILAINLYSVSLLLVLVLSWRAGDFSSTGMWITLAALLGLGLVWMMIRVYVMPTIPSWNTWYTPLSFICTTMSLGATIFLILDIADSTLIPEALKRSLALTLIIVMLLELISSMIHQARIRKLPGGLQKPNFQRGHYYQGHVLRMALLILATIGMSMVYYGGLPMQGSIGNFWSALCLALITGQEFLGRHLFYSSYFRVGF